MEQPATVLLVDDEPDAADLAATFVERASAALETTTETVSTVALDRIEHEDIDCVVSDYNMPDMDGLALFEAVAERGLDVPFILFTGKGSEEIASEALSLGVTDYLQKETGTDQYEVLANRIENAIEARRAEQRLERSEERYGHLIESSPAGIVIVDLEDTIRYANEAAVSFIGADAPEDVLGESTLDLVHPDDEALLRDRWQGSLEDEPQEPTEERFVGLDGETRYALVASTPVTYEGERAIQSVLTDVTQQRRVETALREEREFTERALDALEDAFYVTDATGQLSRWNDQLAAVTGYTDDEIGEMYPAEFVADEDEDRIEAAFSRTIEQGRDTAEVTIETKRGEHVPYELVSTTLTDNHGEVVGVCGTGRDLTERRERERDLERYERMIEAVDDGLYTVDSDGCFTTVNDSFVALTGYDRAELVGSDVSILKDDATVELFENNVRELLDGDHDETYVEFELQTAAGETVSCEDHMALRTDEGEYAGVAGVIRDVTARKQRKRELERYETAIEVAPVGVFVVNPEGRIVWTNERAATTVEHTSAELAGTPFRSLVEEGIISADAPEKYAEILRGLLSSTTNRTAARYEICITPSDGDEHIVDVSVSLLPYDEAFRGAVLVIRDVTERKRREERLEAQATAMDASMDGMAIMGPDEEYIYVNEAHATIYGYDDPEELLGGSWRDLYDPNECERIETTAFGALEETGSWRGETIGRRADGTTFPQELSLTALEDGGIVCVVRDITERAEHQHTIERERERFATLFENIPDPSVYVDLAKETTIRDTNEAFEETFGYAPDETAGESLNDLIVPSEHGEEATDLDRAVADGERIVREVTRKTAAGETREFLFRNATIDGDTAEAFGVYTDISAQKRREQVLAALHDRTREMMATEDPETVASIAVEAAADVLDLPTCGVWLYDEEAEALIPAALTDDGGTLVEDIPTYEPGNSLSWAAFADGNPRTYEDVRVAEAYNPETPIRSEMILPLGEYGVMNIGSTTSGEFEDTDETLARLLATNVEAALERAERERERAAQKRLLERQNQRLDEFAGVVSHDLRNPLTVAGGRLELLSEACESPHIQPIHDALGRMERLIEESLTFARQGKVVTDPERIDIESVAERAWETVETDTVELAVGELGTVKGDDERLRRLFENLFRNAMEHANPTTIRVGPLDTDPGFYVADDGSGIPDAAREQVFERGYTTDETGTGLGLAIVETLAQAHGWAVELAESDTGTRFELRFEPTQPVQSSA